MPLAYYPDVDGYITIGGHRYHEDQLPTDAELAEDYHDEVKRRTGKCPQEEDGQLCELCTPECEGGCGGVATVDGFCESGCADEGL